MERDMQRIGPDPVVLRQERVHVLKAHLIARDPRRVGDEQVWYPPRPEHAVLASYVGDPEQIEQPARNTAPGIVDASCQADRERQRAQRRDAEQFRHRVCRANAREIVEFAERDPIMDRDEQYHVTLAGEESVRHRFGLDLSSNKLCFASAISLAVG